MTDINAIHPGDDGGNTGQSHEAQFCLPDTRRFTLVRRGSDCTYRIDVAIADGVPPAGGWPSIVLLDAAGCFATCVEALRRMSRRPDATGVRPAVVIGISSAGPTQDNRQRQLDLTSAHPDKADTGGAPGFLSFIEDQVKPLVAGIIPLDPDRQTLFGHSLAGYFTLWALANHPAAFRNYAAISPSIWWDPDGLMAALSALAVRDRNLLLCLGEWEDALPPWQRAAPGSADVIARRRSRRMLGNAQALTDRLTSLLGEDRVQFRFLPEEDHASIISAAIPRMLRLASLP